MFDNSKPNVIIITDITDVLSMSRSLGPHKVAYCLRQAGFEVAVIHHASVFSINEISELLKNLVNQNTLFVGINNFFYYSISDIIDQEHGGVELNQVEPGSVLPHGSVYNNYIKNIITTQNPNCQLVLGGPTALDVPHNSIFDYVVVGYAEQSVVSLTKFLNGENVELPPKHKSIYGPTIINDSRAVGYDFSNSHMYYEDHDVILPKETLMLEVGRGCIFKCAFCSYPMNGKKKMDFVRSMKLIRKEIVDNYNRFGVTNYIIVDDTFNDSVEKCIEFSTMIKSLPFKINWWAYIRLDLLAAHPKTIEHLFDSGLRATHFGIETLNKKTASIIGKGGSREKLLDTIRNIKNIYKNSVSLYGSFIFGLPEESLDSIKNTAEFLLSDQNPLDAWRAYTLNIRPNNKSYAHGFLSDLDVNPKKYGYTDLGYEKSPGTSYSPSAKQPHGQMIWRNKHTSYNEIKDLTLEVDQLRKKTNASMNGYYAFCLSGLGIDIDLILNKKDSEIDWHAIDKVKLLRACEYKLKMFEVFAVPHTSKISLNGITTFTDLLKSRKLLA